MQKEYLLIQKLIKENEELKKENKKLKRKIEDLRELEKLQKNQ
jgi:cell division protein FtsB